MGKCIFSDDSSNAMFEAAYFKNSHFIHHLYFILKKNHLERISNDSGMYYIDTESIIINGTGFKP